MPETLWNRCLRVLESELPEQQFNTWVRPLQAIQRNGELRLLAPNRYVIEWLGQNSLSRIKELIRAFAEEPIPEVVLDVGTRAGGSTPVVAVNGGHEPAGAAAARPKRAGPSVLGAPINSGFTFDSFVEGKSNQLAKAAAVQVAGNPGRAYNPLFIYGGVGLGKTHLMHAVANKLKERNSEARLAYVHSERFVSDMVKSLQHNTINDFKTAYRSLDALMIDDIQFFAGKDRSQEEFFHTFNALLESQQQVILTCDRYPKEVDGLEERLKSRFGWGLTVAIEPPELETLRGHFDEQGGGGAGGSARGSGFFHRQAHSFQCSRARRRAAPGGGHVGVHRQAHHFGVGEGGAAGCSGAAGKTGDGRKYSKDRGGILQN